MANIKPSKVAEQINYETVTATDFAADLLEEVNEHNISAALRALLLGNYQLACDFIMLQRELDMAGGMTPKLKALSEALFGHLEYSRRTVGRSEPVPIELDFATNLFGKMKSPERSRLMALINNPNQQTWDDAHGIILNRQNWMTLWQAILAIDPTFPTRGQAKDDRGRVVEKWPRVPTSDLVIRALKYATH